MVIATKRYKAVIIGSGFGGSVTGCRLSKKWPGEVLILERGKRYPKGSFPRSPHDMARNFWNMPDQKIKRPKKMASGQQAGLFDIRSYRHMDAVMAAGLGGGSLIYANVFLEAPDHVFDERWPATCKKDKLDKYYAIAKKVLGARPIPENEDPRRKIVRTDLFRKTAQKMGRTSHTLDINVFFGNDYENPLPIGEQQKNRFGATQTSCVYCAECDLGCNTHSKNTLDLNYLFRAEQEYKAEIRTEHLAVKVVPLNESGDEDPSADGSHGYRVHCRDLNRSPQETAFDTDRVILSAGSMGTTEFLMRCKQVYGSLPRISDQLGKSFSGNGDFLSFTMGGKEAADPNYGPVITQGIDYNLLEKKNSEPSFILEDASYPSFLAWFVEGIKPGFLYLGPLWRTIKGVVGRLFGGNTSGKIGYALTSLLSGDLSYKTSVLLCMGIDKSDGVMKLDQNGNLDVDWKYKNSMALYKAIVNSGKDFKKQTGSKKFFPLPNWLWPFRKNVTVHSLGGCILADDADKGVTSADRKDFGQVFNYKGLYVADGAIVPTAVGSNPIATISALSEMVAEGITEIEPDENL